jgi:hypothetical protein
LQENKVSFTIQSTKSNDETPQQSTPQLSPTGLYCMYTGAIEHKEEFSEEDLVFFFECIINAILFRNKAPIYSYT